MNKSRPDVIEVLNLEKEYHVEQLRRINIALAALKGEDVKNDTDVSKPKRKRSIKWAAEIRNIFDTDLELNLKELRSKLVEKGVPEAMDDSGKNAVYSTVSRLKNREYLERTEEGKYRKKRRRLTRKLDYPVISDETKDDDSVDMQ